MHAANYILKKLEKLPPESIITAIELQKLAGAGNDFANRLERQGKIKAFYKAPAGGGGGGRGGVHKKKVTLFKVKDLMPHFEKRAAKKFLSKKNRIKNYRRYSIMAYNARADYYLKGKSDTDFITASAAAKILRHSSEETFMRVFKGDLYQNENGVIMVKIADFKRLFESEKNFCRVLNGVKRVAAMNQARKKNAMARGKNYNLIYTPGYKSPLAAILGEFNPPTLFELENGDFGE